MECNIIYDIGECMCLIYVHSVRNSSKPIPRSFQHSPLFHVQFETCSKMLHLG